MTAARKQEPCIGPYVLKELLGKGGTAQVLLAWKPTATDEPAVHALKMPLLHYATNEAAKQRFLHEGTLGLRLGEHPNIVSVIDVGLHNGMPYIVMPFVDGVDLAALLQRARKRKRPLSMPSTHHVLSSIAAGLHRAHSGEGKDGKPLRIIHRDVSPSNVLVTRHGIVKLMDFGIGVALDDGTTGNHWRGTARYMSPQHLTCDVCPEMDVYSMGVIAWEMVENRVFRGDLTESKQFWPAIMDGEIPPMQHGHRPLVDLIMACLAFDPHDRPTAAEFSEALAGCVEQSGKASILEREMTLMLQRQWSSGASQRYLEATPELAATLAVVELGPAVVGDHGEDDDRDGSMEPAGPERDAPRVFRKRKRTPAPKLRDEASGGDTTKILRTASPILHPVAETLVSSTATTHEVVPKPTMPRSGAKVQRRDEPKCSTTARKPPEHASARPSGSWAWQRRHPRPLATTADSMLRRHASSPLVVIGLAVLATLVTLLCARWFGMVGPVRASALGGEAPTLVGSARRAE